jgi:hypothetical protein
MLKKSVILLFCSILLISFTNAQTIQDLNIIDAGDTWFTISFNTTDDSKPTIHYGTSFDDLDLNQEASTISTIHEITLTGLETDTLYYYDIEIDSIVDNNNGKHYRFITNIGDGDTYFMSNEGTDSSGFGSFDQPFKTLNYATNQMGAGDTLLVMDGTYTGAGDNVGLNFGSDFAGTENNPITIRAYNAGYGVHPIFDSEFGSGSCSDYHCAVFKFEETHDIVIDSIWVRNIENHLAETGGFLPRYSNTLEFRNCYASDINSGDYGDLSGGFMFCATKNSLVTNSKVWNNYGDDVMNKGGINLFWCSRNGGSHSTDVTTTMTEIWNSDAGVQVKSWGQEDAVFTNNYFHDLTKGIIDKGANTIFNNNIIYETEIAYECVNDYYHTPSQRPIVKQNTITNSKIGVNFADWHFPVVEVVKFENNIIYSNKDGNNYEIIFDTYHPDCKISSDGPYCDEVQALFTYSDYNLFYNPNENNIIDYDDQEIDLDSYKSSSSLDQNSLQVDPLFEDLSSNDFRLSSSSPAKTVSSTNDYLGAVDPNRQIERIEIHPMKIKLEQDQDYLFSVKIYDNNGNEFPPGHFPIEWEADTGTIDENGLYQKTSSEDDLVRVNVIGFTDEVVVYSIDSIDLCGDDVCNYGECNSCNEDCNFDDCCGDTICNNAENCSICETDCDVCIVNSDYHDADENEDGEVSTDELLAYIGLWKTGDKTNLQMQSAIEEWLN